MKLNLLIAAFLLLGISPAIQAQEARAWSKRELTAGVVFQNLSLPFRDMGSLFLHPGISLGLGTNLNKKENLYVHAEAMAYRNANLGNGHALSLRFSWRPGLQWIIRPDVTMGAGWLTMYNPVQTLEWKDGSWQQARGGKSQILIPAGISLEFNPPNKHYRLRPTAGWEMSANLNYNKTIPLVFLNFLKAGIRYDLTTR